MYPADNTRHVNDTKLLALYLLMVAAQHQVHTIILSNSFLKKWIKRSRDSVKRVSLKEAIKLGENLRPVFAEYDPLADNKRVTLHLCLLQKKVTCLYIHL